MDIKKISDESGGLIEYLSSRELKPDEKVAALRSAAGTIESILNAEIITILMARLLSGPRQGNN